MTGRILGVIVGLAMFAPAVSGAQTIVEVER